jgi:hypothetical protein
VEEGVRSLSLDVLLGGALGALIVFVLGVLLEWSRRERERRGLLRLLLAEINHNEIVIKAIDESGTSLPESPHLDKLKTETWEENQQKALGLPDELLEALVSYYQPLEIFRTIQSLPPEDPNRPPRDRPPHSWLEEWVESLAKTFEPLRDAVNELFGLPETKHWREAYEQIMLRAQARAKKRIADYLDRPLWGSLFLQADQWARRLLQRSHHRA